MPQHAAKLLDVRKKMFSKTEIYSKFGIQFNSKRNKGKNIHQSNSHMRKPSRALYKNKTISKIF